LSELYLYRCLCVFDLARTGYGGAQYAAEAQQAREKVRRAVGFSAADEIEKLDRLKKARSISDAEFTRLRTQLLQ
jgi:hypothetical protein